jgi:cytochrome c oxidase subunit 2
MKVRAILTMTLYAIFAVLVSLWMAKQSYTWFPPEASAESKLIDDLFSLFTGLGTFIYLGVIGPFFYSLIFHRAAKYDESDGPPIEGSLTLEIVWTALPIALVLGLSFASYRTYEKMAVEGPMQLVDLPKPQLMQSAYAAPFDETPQREIQGAKAVAPPEAIDVTAKQWAWVFHYPEQGITSTELHLPVNRRVRFTLRSEDVLHGFYIPAFRLKQDIVPNHEIDFELTPTRTGTYRLRDSLYSGTYFAANQADVVVQSPDDYAQWLASAATQLPRPAYNPAAAEFTAAKDRLVPGWQTVPPAPPPVVNYSPTRPLQSPPA